MTKETISETAALKALLSETADHQILAGMLGFVADRLMALDVDQLCGAGVHERSAGRVNHRNGYRPRRWETRAGTVDVQIPKLRKGTYFPECQSRSKKGQCPGAKLDTWFDLGAHPGACAFQIADACQGALAAGQPFRSFGIFRITVWRFCSGATGSFRRSSRGYGRGGLGDREWRL